MPHRSFAAIIMKIHFGNTSEREGETLADSRWSLVSKLLKSINDCRQHYFTPSDNIYVYETISM